MGTNDLGNRVLSLEKQFRTYSEELLLALRYIQPDAASSLTKSRVVLEKLVLGLYTSEMGQEPRKALLGEMLTDNQFTRKIERRIISRMNAIRDMGNLGPHGEPVQPSDAARVLEDLCEVLDWHSRRYPGTDRFNYGVPKQSAAPGSNDASTLSFRTSAGFPSPDPAPGLQATLESRVFTLARNLVWSVIGAIAGASVGGNLGRLGGSAVILARSVIARNALVWLQDNSLLIGAIAGAAAGTVLASIGPVWGPARNSAIRGVLAGAMLGWFTLDIWGWAGLLADRGSRGGIPIWWLAGGLVGVGAGIVGVSLRRNFVSGLLAAITGAILLVADRALLSQSWNLGACALFGAMGGVAAELLARHTAARRGDWSHWFLLAFGGWAAIQAVATHDYRLLQVLTLLTALGGLVGVIVHTVRKRPALGPVR